MQQRIKRSGNCIFLERKISFKIADETKAWHWSNGLNREIQDLCDIAGDALPLRGRLVMRSGI
jgi:hypothetical protein